MTPATKKTLIKLFLRSCYFLAGLLLFAMLAFIGIIVIIILSLLMNLTTPAFWGYVLLGFFVFISGCLFYNIGQEMMDNVPFFKRLGDKHVKKKK